jgi:undecaprenyl-diphosphatase
MVLAAIVLVTISDSVAHYIIKPLVDRVRPCTAISWIRLPDGQRFDPSFPSNHAMNNFAIATFFARTFRNRSLTITLFALAALISLGRIYQGLHYPSDVIGGAMIGCALGYSATRLLKIASPSVLSVPRSENRKDTAWDKRGPNSSSDL